MHYIKVTPITDTTRAIDALNDQLKELESVRVLNGEDANFTAWHDTTTSLLRRFLEPTSPYLARFIDIPFVSQIYPAPPGFEQEMFSAGCKTAEATLKAVVREIERFGVGIRQPEPVVKRGRIRGASQGGVHFHGPVSIENQAIATDNAIQQIGQMGDLGASLKEIADLFPKSDELNRREMKEGLTAIEGLATEAAKPEARRNWNAVLKYGQAVIGLVDKATDLAHKLAPHLPHVRDLVNSAKQALGMG